VALDRRDSTTPGGGGGSEGPDLSVQLRAELDRLEVANPFQALSLDLEATSQEIRSAFLTLTKKYHPSLYARMDRPVVKLANEVFLRVKDAYGCVKDDASREKVLDKLAPKDRAPTATFRGAGARPPLDTPTSSPTTQRSAARGTPASRRGAPATDRPKRPTPSRQTGSQRSRPVSAAHGAGVSAGIADTLQRRNEEYEMALKMITQGRYKDARTLFHKVAAEDPKTKKYRVQMHFSWGLEHEDGGRFDEARKEFERALNIDPEFKRAHEALDRLPQNKKGSGFFSKIFGR